MKKEKVLQYLNQHNIEYELHNHPPAFTVEEAEKYCSHIPGLHCKNLFFRDPKGRNHLLFIFPNNKPIDIKTLGRITGFGRLSFASPERMMRYLGVQPGSVSPFGLINDSKSEVRLYIDQEVKDAEWVTFHPNDNSATLVLSANAFSQYLNSLNNTIEIISTNTTS